MQGIGSTGYKIKGNNMITKGIRGAITVEENTVEAIQEATLDLFEQLVKRNNLTEENVSHIIFSTTKDIDTVYPAKFIRKDFGWNNTAFMCIQEMNVKNALPMCIRILIVVNCNENFRPEYVYLKGATNLRT